MNHSIANDNEIEINGTNERKPILIIQRRYCSNKFKLYNFR